VSRYWEQAEEGGATLLVLHAVPLNLLLGATQKPAGHSVRAVLTVGGRWPDFLDRFGIAEALVGYGSTEAGGLTSLDRVRRAEAHRCEPGFSGRVRDDLEVIVVGKDELPLPDGEIGEILVRPRVPHVMFDGYHGRPEDTLRACTGLWYHSGDQGRLQADGSLHFTGRARDAVRVRGEFVPIEYLEGIIRRHETVEDCAVVGVNSPHGDEELHLFVQLRAGFETKPVELVDYLKPLVPRFMVPQQVSFVLDFPRAPATLKILKRQLIEQVASGTAS